MIMSCVKANKKLPIPDFLGNPKRINVAMTRSKNLLLIIGNSIALKNNNNWKDVLELLQDDEGSYVNLSGRHYYEK